MQRPLWNCPACGRPFANRNQSHSCGRYTIDDFLRGHGTLPRQLFERFAELAQACGQVTAAPARSRVGFQARMIFAAVNRLSVDHLAAHVVLARRLEHARFHRIESISALNHVHHFRVGSLAELDAEVQAWLGEAYLVGEQQHHRTRDGA